MKARTTHSAEFHSKNSRLQIQGQLSLMFECEAGKLTVRQEFPLTHQRWVFSAWDFNMADEDFLN
jgi:hypothetical protein